MERKLTRGIIWGFQPHIDKRFGEEAKEYTVLTVYPIDEAKDEPVEFLFYDYIPNTHRNYVLGKCINITEEIKGILNKTLTQRVEMASRHNPNENYIYTITLQLSKAKRIERYHKSRTS